MNEPTPDNLTVAKNAVLELLHGRNKQARFMTEVFASLNRSNIGSEPAERVIAELQAAGVAMLRDHFCADPHLAGVDLRVVALVDSAEADAQMNTIRRIDEAWNKWLAEYLANHRCG